MAEEEERDGEKREYLSRGRLPGFGCGYNLESLRLSLSRVPPKILGLLFSLWWSFLQFKVQSNRSKG